jgi:RNA recognition motif-containing protein
MPTTTLYVGNIPFKLTTQDLKSLFLSTGAAVSNITIPTDRTSGRPRGFAFVELQETDTPIQDTVNILNGKEVGGRTIYISYAREKEPPSL